MDAQLGGFLGHFLGEVLVAAALIPPLAAQFAHIHRTQRSHSEALGLSYKTPPPFHLFARVRRRFDYDPEEPTKP
jgi:hypothetical protein